MWRTLLPVFSQMLYGFRSYQVCTALWVNFLCVVQDSGLVSFCSISLSSFPITTIEEIVLFPLYWYILGFFVINELAIFVWFLGCHLCWYVFVFMPIPYIWLLRLCNWFKFEQCGGSSFVVTSQDCFGYSVSFVILYKF